MKDFVLKNVCTLDVLNEKLTSPLNIYCSQGSIVDMTTESIPTTDILEYDLQGLLAVPGLIDMHVKLPFEFSGEEPLIKTTLCEAKAGGFTGIACVPDTEPILDKYFLIDYLRNIGLQNHMPIYPMGAITEGLEGKRLSEMSLMKKSGACGFADTSFSTMNSEILRRAMQYALSLGTRLFLDCEDRNLSEGGLIQEGLQSTLYGLKGIPSQSEFLMVARNIALAEWTGCPIHIQSVSTAHSVALIAEAKKRGISVTAETSPAYFSLSCQDILPYSSNFKLKPPLREETDRFAVREAILNDTIDVIVSGHTECDRSQGDNLFHEAAWGSQDLELALALTLTEFQEESNDMKAKILSKMSFRPSQIVCPNEERLLKVGGPANITIIDLTRLWTVDSFRINKESRQTPFLGKQCIGKVLVTIILGEFVYNLLECK